MLPFHAKLPWLFLRTIYHEEIFSPSLFQKIIHLTTSTSGLVIVIFLRKWFISNPHIINNVIFVVINSIIIESGIIVVAFSGRDSSSTPKGFIANPYIIFILVFIVFNIIINISGIVIIILISKRFISNPYIIYILIFLVFGIIIIYSGIIIIFLFRKGFIINLYIVYILLFYYYKRYPHLQWHHNRYISQERIHQKPLHFHCSQHYHR